MASVENPLLTVGQTYRSAERCRGLLFLTLFRQSLKTT